MSHELTITEAFVLKGSDVSEASRMLHLYTRELGLVVARAQGVRKHESKMRYSLQPLSFTLVSLIQGREFWRIVNSQEPESFSVVFKRRESREAVARMLGLVTRLVHGEERNEKLFNHLLKTFHFLKTKELSESQIKNLEVIVSLNILYLLGYLPEGDKLKAFISFDNWTESLLDSVAQIRREALRTIERSFDQTQL